MIFRKSIHQKIILPELINQEIVISPRINGTLSRDRKKSSKRILLIFIENRRKKGSYAQLNLFRNERIQQLNLSKSIKGAYALGSPRINKM